MQQDRIDEAQELHQLVSALADGELRGAELARTLDVLETDGQARRRWADYQLVGEVLRGGSRASALQGDEAFVARLRQRLAQAPQTILAEVDAMPVVPQAAANDAVWRWKLVAGLCTMALVGLLGWQWGGPHADAPVAQLATVEAAPEGAAVATTAEGGVILRDPRLDQLIAAHQQHGGASPLMMPAGFLRNATYERPGR